MRRLRLFLAFCVMALILSIAVSCKPSVPSTFISPDDMEDLLYDYHLADALAGQAKGDYAENVIAYRAAVLKKYGVSQEKFDTSMVYYMRHAVQKVCHIHHMGLFRCILNYSLSLCHRSRHHNIDCSTNRYLIQINMGSL